MPKPSMTPDQLANMPFPRNGLYVSTGFGEQPPGTTPIGQNVRTYEALTMRARGGSREGLSQYIPAQVSGVFSKVQHLNYIVDPTEAALTDDFSGPDALPDGQLEPYPGFPGQFVRIGGSGKQPNRNSQTKKKSITVLALLNYSEAVGSDGGTAQTQSFINYMGGGYPGGLPGDGYYLAGAENHGSVAYAPAMQIMKKWKVSSNTFSMTLQSGQTPANSNVQFFGYPAGASASVNAKFSLNPITRVVSCLFDTPRFTTSGSNFTPDPIVPNFGNPLMLAASSWQPSNIVAVPPYKTGSAVFGFQTYTVQLGWTVTQFIPDTNPIGVVQTFVFTIATFGGDPFP